MRFMIGVFLVFWTTNCFSSVEQVADEFYTKGDYQGAYEEYSRFEQRSPLVEYNLGHCAYELKKYPEALWHWRKSQELWGVYNYFLIEKNISKLPGRVPMNMQQVVVGFFHATPVLLWQVLLLMAWALFLVFLRRRRHRRKLIPLLLILGFFAFAAYLRYQEHTTMHGVVLKAAMLRTGPGDAYVALEKIAPSTEVTIFEERATNDGRFTKVSTANVRGWISTDSIGKTA